MSAIAFGEQFARTLPAELLKYRRTAALWLAVGVPTLVVGLAWVVLNVSNLAEADTEQKWRFLTGMTQGLWASTCLPVGSAILIGMIWGLEHGSNQLKHVMALPPSRHAVFWAKSTGILALLTLGTVVLAVLMEGLANWEGLGTNRDVTLWMPLCALIGSLPAIALLSWVAQRFTAFAWPLVLGVGGLVVGAVAANSEKYWPYVPWAYSLVAPAAEGEVQMQALTLGVGVGAAILAGSWAHFARADAPC